MTRERRQFLRIARAADVSYRFVAPHLKDKALAATYKGKTVNLSASGLLLCGRMPHAAWISELLSQRMALAVAVKLPKQKPIKAICRVQWLDVTLDDGQKEPANYEMGLRFQEIAPADKERLLKFLIESVI